MPAGRNPFHRICFYEKRLERGDRRVRTATDAAFCTVCALGRAAGRPFTTFVLAIALVILWAVSGPIFGWSDTWQPVINTGTTKVTFLMVFVIQNTQSRDTQAMELKLDELIRVNEVARNSLSNLEEMSGRRCWTDDGGIRDTRHPRRRDTSFGGIR
jgi:low affinity Fe/Cu permease